MDNEISSEYFRADKPHASISIAMGSVRTWYARTGLRNYEMYGDALVKATRYETFRKTLLERQPELMGNHILIVQQDVFAKLPESLQMDFNVHELNGFVVRNDASNTKLYYRSEFDFSSQQIVIKKIV